MLFRKSGTFRNIGTQICHKCPLDASILQFCQGNMPLDPPNKARLYSLDTHFLYQILAKNLAVTISFYVACVVSYFVQCLETQQA